MKIIVLKNKITETLGIIERAVGNNTNLPILKNILLRASENKLEASATNLEFAVTYSFSGKIIEPGEITVPAALFSNLVKNLTSERVTLETKGKKLLITTDNYEASIQTQSVEEFPIIPSVQKPLFELKTNTKPLLEAFLSVLPSIQYSEIRPEISGVFIQYHDGFRIVGTDGFRLAERRYEQFERGDFEGLRAIIPLKTSEEITRIFAASEDTGLSVFVDQTQILFKTKELQIISRLIDGNFPDYKQIIPKDVKNEIFVNRTELIQALKLVSSFSGKINDVAIMIGEGKKHLELSSSNVALGENVYKIPAKIKSDDFKVLFNWRFLLDGLKAVQDEDVVVNIMNSDRPAVIRGASNKNFLYVVMPLKV